MSEFVRKKPGRGGGSRGGRGRTYFNGGNGVAASSGDSYSNSGYSEGSRRSTDPPARNKWDEHANETDEDALKRKGLVEAQEMDQAYRESHNGYDREYQQQLYNDYDRDYRDSRGSTPLQQHRPQSQLQQQPPYYDRYERHPTPQRTENYGRDDRRGETCQSIESEYLNWNLPELNREITRIQRRLDVVREMRDRMEEEAYQEERRAEEARREEYYDRGEVDEHGYSSLGRRAQGAQQRRNERERGYGERYDAPYHQQSYGRRGGENFSNDCRMEGHAAPAAAPAAHAAQTYRTFERRDFGRRPSPARKHRKNKRRGRQSQNDFDSDDLSGPAPAARRDYGAVREEGQFEGSLAAQQQELLPAAGRDRCNSDSSSTAVQQTPTLSQLDEAPESNEKEQCEATIPDAFAVLFPGTAAAATHAAPATIGQQPAAQTTVAPHSTVKEDLLTPARIAAAAAAAKGAAGAAEKKPFDEESKRKVEEENKREWELVKKMSAQRSGIHSGSSSPYGGGSVTTAMGSMRLAGSPQLVQQLQQQHLTPVRSSSFSPQPQQQQRLVQQAQHSPQQRTASPFAGFSSRVVAAVPSTPPANPQQQQPAAFQSRPMQHTPSTPTAQLQQAVRSPQHQPHAPAMQRPVQQQQSPATMSDRLQQQQSPMRTQQAAANPRPVQQAASAAPFTPFPPVQQQQRVADYKAAARPAKAIREGKKRVNVVSNVWEFEFEDRLVYRYDVNVGLESVGNDGSTRKFNLNKGPKDDASVHERNELIREALKRGLEMYRVLSEDGCIAVDGAAMMYANEDLEGKLKPLQHEIKVGIEHLSPHVRRFIRNSGVRNVVIEVVASKCFNIKDLSPQASIDRSDIDQSVKQFFEVVTSEHALNSHEFDFFTGGKLYRADPDSLKMGGGNVNAKPIGSGQERRAGMSKGFTLAEKNGELIAALNIDVTTGTFWSEGRLMDTICEINKWQYPQQAVWDARAIKKTNDLIKNLRVSYSPPDETGGGSFDFIANGLTASVHSEVEKQSGRIREAVRLQTIEQLTCKSAEGCDMPLYNKFSNHNLQLKHWPLVESRRCRRKIEDPSKFDVAIEYFPVELLTVKPNQRVPLRKQEADPERAMPVESRWCETDKALKALNLFGDINPPQNDIMNKFGIRLARAPLRTQGIVRAMPGVQFNRAAEVDGKTSFRTGQLSYFKPAHIPLLVIAVSDERREFNPRAFARVLLETARRKQIQIERVEHKIVPPRDLHRQLEDLGVARRANPPLGRAIFMYIEPEASHHHDELKLFERRHLVITQHLTMEIAAKMINNRPTMENVLLKLNVKGGGHNYNVTPEKFALDLWMHGQTMIMGFDVWHPTGQGRADSLEGKLSDPSVVGFSFNGGSTPDAFIGDYHYQRPTKEKVDNDVLHARIRWMLESFEKSRGALPPLIIVVRDGISDGQYRYGMDELEALREGATEWAASEKRSGGMRKPPVHNYQPKFIFVIATKRHHKRMYTENAMKRIHENMPAMTVVDDTIAAPSLFEFYLQSHTPLQGMAKATKYTVLKDDVGTTMDAMQALMGALCFEHQISTNAISIPEPVYQSDEWAKRGAANMRKYKELYGENGQFKSDMTYEKLTDRLAYWTCALGQTRVNA